MAGTNFFRPSTPAVPRAISDQPAESTDPRLVQVSKTRRAKREVDPHQ
jgi:hypothetical protein